ncbi:MAG: hypothetical protein ACJAZ5_002926 [Alloalcanivorax venustensis]|jgi:hypothetical protein
MAERPPEEVVDTRIRNRIMEYLQLVTSAAQQKDYQRRVPDVNVPTELICSWEDWMPVEEGAQEFAPPVYSAEECEAIERYGRSWEAIVAATPEEMPSLEEFIGMPEWERLKQAAEDALSAFQRRGVFEET